ncbi:hypothetical protein AGMMS4956_02900 [Bacteroidia bacterium]|nr:hypothetical protein AGMMS4956_02900 [Bacteroidia bacterium]
MDQIQSILAIVGIFFVPLVAAVLIVLFVQKSTRRRNELQADLCAKALEKGMELPADLFAAPKKQHNPFKTGIICIAAGVGIVLFFALTALLTERDAIAGAPIGIVPLAIGGGYLLIHRFNQRKGKVE